MRKLVVLLQTNNEIPKREIKKKKTIPFIIAFKTIKYWNKFNEVKNLKTVRQ